MGKQILFISFILVSILNLSFVISAPVLECPVNPVSRNYVFNTQTSIGTKSYLQLGYGIGFSQEKYKKITLGKTFDKELEKYFEKSSDGKFYARAVSESKPGKEYSNVCEFTLDYFKVLDDSSWVYGNYQISSEKASRSKKSLKVPFVNAYSEDAIVFANYNIPDNALVEAQVYTPSNCNGQTYNKNYLQIAYTGTRLFRGSGWKSLKVDFAKSGYSPELLIKIGTFGECNGNFYIDNVKITRPDGKVLIYNFE